MLIKIHSLGASWHLQVFGVYFFIYLSIKKEDQGYKDKNDLFAFTFDSMNVLTIREKLSAIEIVL